MKRINLKGKYKRNSTSVKDLPDYYFLPTPTHVTTDFQEVSTYSVRIIGEFIHWDVTWVGKRNCDQVMRHAKNNLDKWTQLNNIYKKIQSTTGKKDYTKDLIKNSMERIQHWKSVINEIVRQGEN